MQEGWGYSLTSAVRLGFWCRDMEPLGLIGCPTYRISMCVGNGGVDTAMWSAVEGGVMDSALGDVCGWADTSYAAAAGYVNDSGGEWLDDECPKLTLSTSA